MTNELLPKLSGFFEQIWLKFVTLEVGGAIWVHFGRFPLFHGASNMCTNFFSESIWLSCAQLSPSPKEENPPPILSILFERYWLPNLTPTFEQLMGPAPKTSNASLTKIPTCLEHEVFMCYFGPHGSGHYPTLVDTFHPCRLPPSGSRTQSWY